MQEFGGVEKVGVSLVSPLLLVRALTVLTRCQLTRGRPRETCHVPMHIRSRLIPTVIQTTHELLATMLGTTWQLHYGSRRVDDAAGSTSLLHSRHLALRPPATVLTSRNAFHLVQRPQADSVAVLQGGAVTEQGTFSDLMAKPNGLLVNLMEGGHRM